MDKGGILYIVGEVAQDKESTEEIQEQKLWLQNQLCQRKPSLVKEVPPPEDPETVLPAPRVSSNILGQLLISPAKPRMSVSKWREDCLPLGMF